MRIPVTNTVTTLAALLFLSGCPTGGITTSGDQRPDPDLAARAELAAENDRLHAEVTRLRALLRAASAADEGLIVDPDDPGLGGDDEPPLPDLVLAVRLYEDGDLLGALAEGYAVLDAMDEVGIDSMTLRLLLGTWALESGDGVLAEEQFEIVAQSVGQEQRLVEEATSGLSAARELILGPEAAALADARDALDRGELALADRLCADLVISDATPELIREAELLRDDVRLRATELAEASLARADDLLSGPGPYDLVTELLDEVRGLPDGTWDPDEERRLRAWHRGATAENDPVVEADRQALDEALAEARDLVASADYRDALEVFAELDGTPLQETARREAAAAAEVLVKEERERAGTLFVAARRKPDADSRVAAMQEVRQILVGLLSEFPESGYADRVRRNLDVVEKDLRAEGWTPEDG